MVYFGYSENSWNLYGPRRWKLKNTCLYSAHHTKDCCLIYLCQIKFKIVTVFVEKIVLVPK